MIVLLPPSEGKAATPPRRRGPPVRLDRLTLPALTDRRQAVLDALVAVSGRPDAATTLKVPAGLTELVAANVTVPAAPARPAAEVYTGVLYEALDLGSLPAAARARASRSVLVQSALWGPVGPADRIAPYRLSMGVSLPGIGPLAAFWRGALEPLLPDLVGGQLVVDCRSTDYAAAWRPGPEVARRTVAVRVTTERDGVRSVVSHQAKHTRGLVTRWLLQAPPVRTVGQLAALIAEHAPCVLLDQGRAGWVLDVTVPPVDPVRR